MLEFNFNKIKNLHTSYKIIFLFLFTYFFSSHLFAKEIFFDKTYDLIKINNATPITSDHTIFISFTKDNKFNGYSGCNLFRGIYAVKKEGRLIFSNIATTRKICLDATIQSQEYTILKFLQDSLIYNQNIQTKILDLKNNTNNHLIWKESQ